MLSQAPLEDSPKKKKKRSKDNKRKTRKRLKLHGKEYTTAKGKTVLARKEMQWTDCKCKNKCATNLVENDRKTLHDKYWNLTSDKYHLTNSDNERMQVCSKVFFSTLQVTTKFVRYTRQNEYKDLVNLMQEERENQKTRLMVKNFKQS